MASQGNGTNQKSTPHVFPSGNFKKICQMAEAQHDAKLEALFIWDVNFERQKKILRLIPEMTKFSLSGWFHSFHFVGFFLDLPINSPLITRRAP